jgi:hypothetical protein
MARGNPEGSDVNDVQAAFDPIQAKLDAVDAFRLGGEIAMQKGDFGFE